MKTRAQKDGLLKCCSCPPGEEWKAPEEFSLQRRGSQLRRFECRACGARRNAERYRRKAIQRLKERRMRD